VSTAVPDRIAVVTGEPHIIARKSQQPVNRNSSLSVTYMHLQPKANVGIRKKKRLM
jgi:hypothetical protein